MPQYSVGDPDGNKKLKEEQKVVGENIQPESEGQRAQPKRDFRKDHAEHNHARTLRIKLMFWIRIAGNKE